jgi:Leucine-rich repeat (LRR) protein
VSKKIAQGYDKYTMSIIQLVPESSPEVYLGSRLEFPFQPNLSELRAVKTCYLNHNEIVSLYTGLFPPNVEHLHLGKNLITAEGLPTIWPPHLKTLNLEMNEIQDTKRVEFWPENLEELCLNDNPLEIIPENLPSNLRHLSICYANLHTLENLPPSLKLLRSFYNSIKQIKSLPATLEHLNIGYNYLTSSIFVGLTLPHTLRYLNLDSNNLSWLPDTLPDSLEYVSAVDNKLTCLPYNLPKSLKHLIVNKNRIYHFDPVWKPNQTLQQLHIRNNFLTENLLSLQESGRVQAVYQGNNWNQEIHHLCAWTIQKAFYVYKVKLGIRSWARLNKVVGELLEVAYLPEYVVRHHEIPTRSLWKQ